MACIQRETYPQSTLHQVGPYRTGARVLPPFIGVATAPALASQEVPTAKSLPIPYRATQRQRKPTSHMPASPHTRFTLEPTHSPQTPQVYHVWAPQQAHHLCPWAGDHPHRPHLLPLLLYPHPGVRNNHPPLNQRPKPLSPHPSMLRLSPAKLTIPPTLPNHQYPHRFTPHPRPPSHLYHHCLISPSSLAPVQEAGTVTCRQRQAPPMPAHPARCLVSRHPHLLERSKKMSSEFNVNIKK